MDYVGVSELRDWGFRVQGLGLRVEGLGFRVSHVRVSKGGALLGVPLQGILFNLGYKRGSPRLFWERTLNPLP